MAPINLPDGTEVSEVILPDGASASEVIAPDGSTVFGAIPDSVASREPDDLSTTLSSKHGLKIELKSDYPSIGARISQMTSSVSTAYLWDSSQTEIATTDISSLTGGDAFTFDDVGLTSGSQYYIVLDNNGADATFGYPDVDPGNYPYTSADVDIIARYAQGEDQRQPIAVNDIGNVGFS